MSGNHDKVSQTTDPSALYPNNLGPDLRFWILSFEMQVHLGRSIPEAKAHANHYISKLRGT